MRRIFPDFAYGPGPRESCWWNETISAPQWPELQSSENVDVAIIGAGFTGISAAVHLAETGCRVAVLEAETPGWGASGRNGGFCCLGGAKISEKSLVHKYGSTAAREYLQSEHDAVALVDNLIKRFGLNVDRHSNGETVLAHRKKDMIQLHKDADEFSHDFGKDPTLIEAADLAENGMQGPFHGALTLPVGFALNPRKYLFGLADTAISKGANLYQKCPALSIKRIDGKYHISTPKGHVVAENVLIATNGYSSEDTPDWLASRYLPSQSNVLVTRPLSQQEISDQGWSTDQMAYDTRNLLHYFRLMPDRRFLFGTRGGLMSSPAAEKRARQKNRTDFERMFPAWRHVSSENQWSGLVCLSRRRLPFAGAVPGHPGMYAGFAYHGNGVAMGSYTGKVLADKIAGTDHIPEIVSKPPTKFPFGRFRRLLMPCAYLYYGFRDF